MFRFTIPRAFAALMIATAVLAPAAGAQPIDAVSAANTATQSEPAQAQNGPTLPLGVRRGYDAPPVRSALPTNTPSSGFDWGDAAIGAATMFALMTLAAGAVLGVRRSRERSRPAVTS